MKLMVSIALAVLFLATYPYPIASGATRNEESTFFAEDAEEEIIRFCKDNGHKYLTVLEDQETQSWTKQRLHKSGSQL